MKVICKSNEYIAISTKKPADCLYQLGRYLNKETCTVEMGDKEVRKITCTKKAGKWSETITLETDLTYSDRYIILDKDGNLVNVVTEEQFNDRYAILKEGE